MKSDKRKATAARNSLPLAAPSSSVTQPPTTPVAPNRRSKRHSTATPSLDTRPSKSPKTQPIPSPTSEQSERKEADAASSSDAAFTALCTLISSLATLLSEAPDLDRSAFTSHHRSILSSLYRLSPPTTLSPHHPPSAAVLPLIDSTAYQLSGIVQSLLSITPSSSLLLSRLQQLHSIRQQPLSSSDTYAVLLSSAVALSQLLSYSAASHSSSTPSKVHPLDRSHMPLVLSVPAHLNLRMLACSCVASLNGWEQCMAALSTAALTHHRRDCPVTQQQQPQPNTQSHTLHCDTPLTNTPALSHTLCAGWQWWRGWVEWKVRGASDWTVRCRVGCTTERGRIECGCSVPATVSTVDAAHYHCSLANRDCQRRWKDIAVG